jgi:hypothetical protein
MMVAQSVAAVVRVSSVFTGFQPGDQTQSPSGYRSTGRRRPRHVVVSVSGEPAVPGVLAEGVAAGRMESGRRVLVTQWLIHGTAFGISDDVFSRPVVEMAELHGGTSHAGVSLPAAPASARDGVSLAALTSMIPVREASAFGARRHSIDSVRLERHRMARRYSTVPCCRINGVRPDSRPPPPRPSGSADRQPMPRSVRYARNAWPPSPHGFPGNAP